MRLDHGAMTREHVERAGGFAAGALLAAAVLAAIARRSVLVHW